MTFANLVKGQKSPLNFVNSKSKIQTKHGEHENCRHFFLFPRKLEKQEVLKKGTAEDAKDVKLSSEFSAFSGKHRERGAGSRQQGQAAKPPIFLFFVVSNFRDSCRV